MAYLEMSRAGTAGMTVVALLTAIMLVGSIVPSLAHVEPPKTQAERAEQQQERSLFASCRVASQTIMMSTFDPSSTVPVEKEYLTNVFDVHGDLVEQVVNDPSRAERTTSSYDDTGSWLEERTYGINGATERTVFSYNNEGLIDKIMVYDSHDVPTEVLAYRYLPAESVIELNKRDGGNNLLYSIRYDYEPGSMYARQAATTQTDAEGKLMTSTRNANLNGHRATKTVMGDDGSVTCVFAYAYTAEGRVGEVVRRSATGAVEWRQIFTYRADGLPESVRNYDAEGKPTRFVSYVYEFFSVSP